MLLHNPAKLPPIDRFEKLPKNAIYAAHARPLSESRQPESIQFVLDLPGMRCGIVNHSPDSPARLRGEVGKQLPVGIRINQAAPAAAVERRPLAFRLRQSIGDRIDNRGMVTHAAMAAL